MPSLTYGLSFFCPGKQPLVVGFILGEQQRRIAFAVESELTEHRMRSRDRARAG